MLVVRRLVLEAWTPILESRDLFLGAWRPQNWIYGGVRTNKLEKLNILKYIRKPLENTGGSWPPHLPSCFPLVFLAFRGRPAAPRGRAVLRSAARGYGAALRHAVRVHGVDGDRRQPHQPALLAGRRAGRVPVLRTVGGRPLRRRALLRVRRAARRRRSSA